MSEIILSTSDHLLFIIMGIIPLLVFFQSQPLLEEMTPFSSPEKLQIYYGNSIFQWIGVGAIIALWYINDRSYEDSGFGSPEMSWLAWAVIIAFLIFYAIDMWKDLRSAEQREATRQKWIKDIPFLPVNWYELQHFFFVALSAGVCEEIIFRGFFIPYFLAWNQDNLMGTWLSIIIPACLFAFGHLYQGHQAVFKTMFMAALFGWIFVLTKSLWIPIIIHILIDAISGYLAMRVLSEKD